MHRYCPKKSCIFPLLLMVMVVSAWGQTSTTETVKPPPTYVVKNGDSLSKIAKTVYGDASLWPVIHRANRKQVPQIDKIEVGLTLLIPARGQSDPTSQETTDPPTLRPPRDPSDTGQPQSGAMRALRLVTGSSLPPLVDPSLPQQGMLAELVREVFKAAEYDVQIKFWEWNDGLQATRDGVFDGAFPRAQDAEHAVQFFASRPLHRVVIRAFVRRVSPVEFNTLQDLQGSTVCQPDGQPLKALQPLIDQQLITLTRPKTLETCFNLLVRSRVDVVVINELVGESVLQQMALTDEVCFLDKAIALDTLHVLFPKTAPDSRALVYEFDQALGRIERAGARRDISSRHMASYYQSQHASATVCAPARDTSSPVARQDPRLEGKDDPTSSEASPTATLSMNPAEASTHQLIQAPDSDSLHMALAKAPRDVLLPQRQHGEFLASVPPARPPVQLNLVSVPVTTGPTIDGHSDDGVWETAPVVTTLDFASQRPITLQSVHTAEEIFFLVTYLDQSPSETHKTWSWDAQESIYKQMGDREDTFVFKWSMVGNEVNLGFLEAEPHRADVWYWKAHRTNQSGYADDKWHVITSESRRKAKRVWSPTHGALEFQRLGDAGSPAYEEKQFYDYQNDTMPRYAHVQPRGSRADVRAKGVWRDEKWTLEFGRKLRTGQDDDVAFDPGKAYLFAVSCYEMAYGKVNPELSQPLYKTGDAFDRLFLKFAKKDDR